MPAQHLLTESRLQSPDDVYEALVALVGGLDGDRPLVVMSGLALMLANHIGDDRVVHQAIEQARSILAQPDPMTAPPDDDRTPGGALRAIRRLVDVEYVGLGGSAGASG